jgi:N-acylneuraminate cytidylyltransferase
MLNTNKKKSVLAIIPARGGSKRIPYKNIKKFSYLPIIAWSIKAAKNSKLFDEIMVSTEDDKIAKVSKKFGAKIPFKRSKKNSKDSIPLTSVLEEVLTKYITLGKEFDYVCCIYAAAPLIKKKHLIDGLKKLKTKGCNSVISVSEFEGSIWNSFKIKEKGKLNFNFKKNFLNKHDNKANYYHDGQWFWFKTSSFLKSKKIIGKNTRSVLIPKHLSQDINTPEDWKLAEIKFKYQENKN